MRYFVLAIAIVGAGVLFCAPARAATPMRCEERNANCLGGCRDATGGAGDWKGRPNRCMQACVRQLLRCYPVYRPPYSAPLN